MESAFDPRAAGSCGSVPDAGEQPEHVEVVIPASHRLVRLARLVASGVGSGLGADVDRIEELRLLVDEACALLLECAVPRVGEEDRLHLGFRSSSTSVTLTVERPRATLADRPSPVTMAVLDSISDHWSLQGTTVTAIVTLDVRAGDERDVDTDVRTDPMALRHDRGSHLG